MWLLGLGTAAADARLLGDYAAIRSLAVTSVAFGVLQAIALARLGPPATVRRAEGQDDGQPSET